MAAQEAVSLEEWVRAQRPAGGGWRTALLRSAVSACTPPLFQLCWLALTSLEGG